jgi:hypothetical protein
VLNVLSRDFTKENHDHSNTSSFSGDLGINDFINVEKATTLNLCSTQFRPKVPGKTIHTIIGSVGIAIANFTEQLPTLSGGMVGIPTYLTYFLGMSSVHYLSLQLGGIMW